ncbi:MAG TPA: hypothetical protein VL172_02395 [Kofleriaceae bacterium]|jgi:hypothetical protein|nr:hypothetical protein [Kofleriaceae bacterium]
MRRSPLLPLLLSTPLALIACGTGDHAGGDDDDGPDAAAGPTYTWHHDIAPLVAEHCWTCHTDTGVAAEASLQTYAGAYEAASLMAEKTARREMPPWGAGESADCTPRYGFRDDLRLTDAQIEMFQVWNDEGAPEGDPATAVPLPDPPQPRTLSGATHVLQPAAAFTTTGEDDQLICSVLDPQLTGARWLTGMEVVPGTRQAVHHVVLTVVPPDQVAEIEALAGPDGQFECFGGLTVQGLYPLGVWVPGADPMELPGGVGVPLAAGSKLIMQVHYHPAGESYQDRTTARLRLVSTPPGRNYTFFAVGNAFQAPELLPDPDDRGAPEFRVPADVAEHTEEMEFAIALDTEQRFPMLTAFPHQHYLGTTLQVNIERAAPPEGEPAEECLLYVPRWNFDWQRTYTYDSQDLDALPTVGNGDKVHIKCTYDNTEDNEFVQRALAEQHLTSPIDVYLGEQSLDEMCLAAFGVLF